MTRLMVAVVVAAHGVIHLIGFVVPWQMLAVTGFPYRTTAASGVVDLGDAGMRLVGVVWLVCALGFVVAGVGIARRAAWTLPLIVGLAVVSLVVCVIGLPETAAGIAVNIVMLCAAAWTTRVRTTTVEVAR